MNCLSSLSDQTKEVKELGSIWKTAGIAVGCAAGYILLMVLLMLYLEHRKINKQKRQERVAFIGRENCEYFHSLLTNLYRVYEKESRNQTLLKNKLITFSRRFGLKNYIGCSYF